MFTDQDDSQETMDETLQRLSRSASNRMSQASNLYTLLETAMQTDPAGRGAASKAMRDCLQQRLSEANPDLILPSFNTVSDLNAIIIPHGILQAFQHVSCAWDLEGNPRYAWHTDVIPRLAITEMEMEVASYLLGQIKLFASFRIEGGRDMRRSARLSYSQSTPVGKETHAELKRAMAERLYPDLPFMLLPEGSLEEVACERNRFLAQPDSRARSQSSSDKGFTCGPCRIS
ncbi:MAG: hypothetical protein A3J38_08675 [Gammaproteobacteria bacterium RIFCSPHIGHO2_12_FULL_45_9]|nr:MAG: hypothetical protein A3J38_08675 [Gammaproteobacteria bacterium RIFCSPHIGHO2_12_FULL_45_9]